MGAVNSRRSPGRRFGVRRPDGVVVTTQDEQEAIELWERHRDWTLVSQEVVTYTYPWEPW